MSAARFDSALASIDGSDLVIALFRGENPEPVALLICGPVAARGLIQEIGSALETGISDGVVTRDE